MSVAYGQGVGWIVTAPGSTSWPPVPMDGRPEPASAGTEYGSSWRVIPAMFIPLRSSYRHSSACACSALMTGLTGAQNQKSTVGTLYPPGEPGLAGGPGSGSCSTGPVCRGVFGPAVCPPAGLAGAAALMAAAAAALTAVAARSTAGVRSRAE